MIKCLWDLSIYIYISVKCLIKCWWVASKSIDKLSQKCVYLIYLYSIIFVHLQKCLFSVEHSWYFLILAQNIGCGYTLDLNRPPWTSLNTAKLGHDTRVYIIFLILTIKHRMWMLIRTALLMQFYQVPTIYVLSSNKKNHLHSFDNCNFQSRKDHRILNWCLMCIQLLFLMILCTI